MTSSGFARDRLRAEVRRLLDEYEAMLVLLASMNAPTKRRLNDERAAIERAPKKLLRSAADGLRNRLHELRRDVGATQRIGEYAVLLKKVEDKPGLVMRLSALMAVHFFSKYPVVAEKLERDELSAHAYIELDVRGEYEPQQRLELHIVEAMLFEDMCMFWNDSCEITPDPRRPHATKAEVKRLQALHRAAVSSAFYMVEAYLNGIAFEVFLTREADLNEREREMVTEWDAKRARPKYLTIRDKILHYPRLLAKVAAPLLQENNCSELAFFLTSAKQFRDAIVHASPPRRFDRLETDKEVLFAELDHEQCGQVVDSAIAVVDELATALTRAKSVFWLQRRRSDGLFDPSAFE